MAHPATSLRSFAPQSTLSGKPKSSRGSGSFTSCNHPVQIEDRDVDALSRFYRNSTSAGVWALLVSSPGGKGLGRLIPSQFFGITDDGLPKPDYAIWKPRIRSCAGAMTPMGPKSSSPPAARRRQWHQRERTAPAKMRPPRRPVSPMFADQPHCS